MAWVAVVAAVVSEGAKLHSAKKQMKAEKKTQMQQQASQYEQQLVERRNLIRERRIKQAQLMQASEASGTSGSSGEIGALGAMATQFNSGQSFLDSQQQIAKNITGIQQRLNKDLFAASVVKSTADVVQSMYGSGITSSFSSAAPKGGATPNGSAKLSAKN